MSIKCVESQLLFSSTLSSVLVLSPDSVPLCLPFARSIFHLTAHSMPWSRTLVSLGRPDVESSTAPFLLVRRSSSASMQSSWTVPIAIQSQDRPSLLTCATVHDADDAIIMWSRICQVVTNSIRSHRVHGRWYLFFSKPVVGTSRVDQVGICLARRPDLRSTVAD